MFITSKIELRRILAAFESRCSELEAQNDALRDVNRDCRRMIEKLKEAYILKNNELVALKMKGEKKMTNFEYYKDEILKLNDNRGFALVNGKPNGCTGTHCGNCEFGDASVCKNKALKWLYAEYIEKPKLTKRERLFCELVNIGWIVRDITGSVYYYTFKPGKEERHWITGKPASGMRLNDFRFQLDFNFIKWEDEEPWSVQDLLKLEVEE